MGRLPGLLAPSVLACALGCAGDAPRGVPDAGGQTHARLVLTVTAPRDGDVTLAAQARLIRFREMDLDAAELLVGAEPTIALDQGRCVIVDGEALVDETLTRLSPDAAVELLDAGDLMFRAARSAVGLSPRYASDMLPFVTGASYRPDGEVEAAPPELAAVDEAVVSAFGGDDVGAFEAHVAVPAVPRLGPLDAVRRGAPLLVTWSADGATSGEGVVVSLARDGLELRCTSADAGRWTFPRDAVQTFLDRVDGDSVELSVERVARAPVAALGLDGGELVVAVRDVIPLSVE
jgi:hypothetical protein